MRILKVTGRAGAKRVLARRKQKGREVLVVVLVVAACAMLNQARIFTFISCVSRHEEGSAVQIT